jgi:hypothetical protein
LIATKNSEELKGAALRRAKTVFAVFALITWPVALSVERVKGPRFASANVFSMHTIEPSSQAWEAPQPHFKSTLFWVIRLKRAK